MSQELIPYDFKGKPVRILMDDNNNPWWVARDVCEALDLASPEAVYSRLDPDEKGIVSTDTPGGEQRMITVNEPGLYSLILASRKPQAHEFKRWVTHDVIPSIRKTGIYSRSPISALDMIIAMAQEQKKALTRLSAVETRLQTYETRQQAVTAVLAPVKEVSTRLKLSQIIREAAYKNNKDFRLFWERLYFEFKYRYSIDLTARAKNARRERLDVAEELGLLPDLFALAVKLFVG